MIRLALAGVLHHARVLVGVVAGVALTTALVVAGLALGDVLRAALEARVAAQLGPVVAVVETPDRRVTEGFADRLGGVPLLAYDAVARGESGSLGVHLLGVDARLQALAADFVPPEPGQVRLGERTAAALGVVEGDTLIVRVERPGALPREAAIMQDEGRIVGLRLTVGPLLGAAWPTSMGWRARPDLPHDLFVDLGWLQGRLAVEGRANVVLLDETADAAAALRPEDLGLVLDEVAGEWLLGTERILLDDAVVRAVGDRGVLASTWFADEIRHDDRASAYAFVAAVGDGDIDVNAELSLTDAQIALNAWMADALQADVGDAVVLRVPVLGASRGLTYEERSLEVAQVLPVEGPFADDTWMPPFEGLAGRASCREWDPGIPVDLDKIGDDDEAYWDAHGGTPKAWVSLGVDRALWSSGYGLATSIRFPVGVSRDEIETALEVVRPEEVGIVVREVAGAMRASASPANDFGALFLGFEFVLVASALLLAGMLFAFQIASRSAELGTLRSIGWSDRRVRQLVWTEGALVAALGVLLGVPLAWAVMRALLWGLDAVWRDAIGAITLSAVLPVGTLVLGAVASWGVSMAALAWASRSLLQQEARDLLARTADVHVAPTPRWLLPVAGASLAAAVAIVVATPAARTPMGAIAFFIAGFALLASGLSAVRWLLGRHGPAGSLFGWSWRATTRRPGRALAVVSLLAFGAFLVVGVGLGGGQGADDPSQVDSGTGGYDLWVETTLAIPHVLDSEAGRDAYALRESDLPDGSVLPLRKLSGDDASCHQLGSAQTPSLLGVDPSVLAERGAFAFTSAAPHEGSPWSLLGRAPAPGRIAAIGDVGTVTWGLHLGLGDVLRYQARDGDTVDVEIVGITANAVFQGGLVVAEQDLLQHFPDTGGSRVFLVDAADPARTTKSLARGLEDAGAIVRPAGAQLARFKEVEHTYVAIFHALGGLGLVLGGLGVGVVLARSVLERRGELQLLHAVGWPHERVVRALVLEHATLVVLGLGLGAVCAALAVAPIVTAADAHPPWGIAVAVLFGTGVVALLGVVVAARWALARER